jgi:hypothetical protein
MLLRNIEFLSRSRKDCALCERCGGNLVHCKNFEQRAARLFQMAIASAVSAYTFRMF